MRINQQKIWPIIASSYFRPLLTTFCKIKRDIDMLPCLRDLDLFYLNTVYNPGQNIMGQLRKLREEMHLVK